MQIKHTPPRWCLLCPVNTIDSVGADCAFFVKTVLYGHPKYKYIGRWWCRALSSLTMMTSDGDFDYVQTFRYYNGEFYVVPTFTATALLLPLLLLVSAAAASLTRFLPMSLDGWLYLYSAAIHFILIISIWTGLDDMVLLASTRISSGTLLLRLHSIGGWPSASRRKARTDPVSSASSYLEINEKWPRVDLSPFHWEQAKDQISKHWPNLTAVGGFNGMQQKTY